MTYRKTLLMAFVAEKNARRRRPASLGTIRRSLFDAAIQSIRGASPHHAGGTEWLTGEAALAWAIFEQGCRDHYGVDTHTIGTRIERKDFDRSAEELALTGVIVIPGGKRANILELLGLDAEWATLRMAKSMAVMEELAA